MRAIAEHFHRDPVVMSQGVKKIEQRFLRDHHFVQMMDALEKELIRGKKIKILN